MGVSAPGSAQDSASGDLVLTEQKAVSRALTRRALQHQWKAQIDADTAEALDVGAWPNPQVGYTREQTFEEPHVAAEDEVLLEQTLPLSGRRALFAEGARMRAQATRLQTRADARRIATQVRHAFYRVLSVERRLQTRDRWLEQMKQVERAMVRRVEAGESAPYELERLRREVADVQAAVSVEQAELVRRRAHLAGLLGQPAARNQWTISGELLPRDIVDEATVRAAIAKRPEFAAAQKRVEAAKLDIEAASRWWFPEPTLTGGYKGVSVAGDRSHGFVAGIALGIPVFDRHEGQRMAAEAALVRAESQKELIEQQLRAEIVGLAEQVRTLSKAAEAYQKAGVERAQRVFEVARQAYDAGEVGILELIDAYRGAVDSKLRLLELQAQTRQRHIDLQRSLQVLEEQLPSDKSD